MKINPYLMFDGRCAEAFAFYATALGGTVEMMMTFGEAPERCPQTTTEWDDKIIHASLLVGDQRLMGADVPPQYQETPQGFSVSINVEDVGEAERIFGALGEGATITMPMGETFWALRFGMLVDRYGTPWMVNCSRPR
ncbi:MAG: VOC family protein [Rhodospirillales bacterium]